MSRGIADTDDRAEELMARAGAEVDAFVARDARTHAEHLALGCALVSTGVYMIATQDSVDAARELLTSILADLDARRTS